MLPKDRAAQVVKTTAQGTGEALTGVPAQPRVRVAKVASSPHRRDTLAFLAEIAENPNKCHYP